MSRLTITSELLLLMRSSLRCTATREQKARCASTGGFSNWGFPDLDLRRGIGVGVKGVAGSDAIVAQ